MAEKLTDDLRAVAIREWNAACSHADDRMEREIAAARQSRDETVTRATAEVNGFLAGSEEGIRITASASSRPDYAAAWQALRDHLTADIRANREVAVSCQGAELRPTKDFHDGMVKAQQEALAKMQELEARQ